MNFRFFCLFVFCSIYDIPDFSRKNKGKRNLTQKLFCLTCFCLCHMFRTNIALAGWKDDWGSDLKLITELSGLWNKFDVTGYIAAYVLPVPPLCNLMKCKQEVNQSSCWLEKEEKTEWSSWSPGFLHTSSWDFNKGFVVVGFFFLFFFKNSYCALPINFIAYNLDWLDNIFKTTFNGWFLQHCILVERQKISRNLFWDCVTLKVKSLFVATHYTGS